MISLQAQAISDPAELAGVPAQKIGCANWKAFPGGPAAFFRIARLGDDVCVLFEVEEADPRTVNHADGTPVYQDSCVEFFCKVPGSGRYFNFEFNSEGMCRAASRIARKEDVKPLAAEEYARILRQPSRADGKWRLMVTIPIDLIAGRGKAVDRLLANFYKCGDLTAEPHYLSWAPIVASKPDFHRPECFGSLTV